MVYGVPSQREPARAPEATPVSDSEALAPLVKKFDAATIEHMIAQGYVTVEELEAVTASLDEEILEQMGRRYETLVATLENMQRQEAMLREQLGLAEAYNDELAVMNEQLSKDVMTDYLTGLGSLRALDTRRDELLARLHCEDRRAGEGAAVAVVVMSVDIINMKAANAVSQQEGDRLIVEVAKYLATHFRAGDLFRRGGDEFIGLFPVRTEQDFSTIYNKMRELTEKGTGRRLRLGYYVSYANGTDNLTEAEELADPKTHLMHRLWPPGVSMLDALRQKEEDDAKSS